MEKDDQVDGVSKLRYIYIHPEAYEKHFINGAIGGLTPRGEILCNFFFEYKELPDFEDADIENNQVVPLKESAPVMEIVREIKCGIIVKPDQARKIAEWLVNNADSYDSHFAQDKNANLSAKL
jgi:hypothetical protein